jgi:hypothetical protein
MAGHPFARVVSSHGISDLPKSFPAHEFTQGMVYSHEKYIGYLTSFGGFVDQSLSGQQEEIHVDALQDVYTLLLLAFFGGAMGVLLVDLLVHFIKRMTASRRVSRHAAAP